ncbi:hypothetical protein PIB30_059673 [Stylosanthes scabra]|uniref:Uncharacterized protein n=1 Tax=Stylosanthes scabra TaxID=79078 RepID=A0ABU6YMU8_9FABA|nr:hypothetical protein [Stylosanthes scabra]
MDRKWNMMSVDTRVKGRDENWMKIRNRFEVLSNVFIRLCQRNRVDSGYPGIDSIPAEIEKHVSTILERRDMIVYDRGRMIGPRESTNDGYPVLVLDRSGMAMITDRVNSS